MTKEDLASRIDEERAKEMVKRFLGQYHTVIDTKAVLDNGIWQVTAHLGFANTQTKVVRIDATSGMILECI
ncbi:MAG: hypothetical protein ACREBI_10985 [Nitrosotalea sp.]